MNVENIKKLKAAMQGVPGKAISLHEPGIGKENSKCLWGWGMALFDMNSTELQKWLDIDDDEYNHLVYNSSFDARDRIQQRPAGERKKIVIALLSIMVKEMRVSWDDAVALMESRARPKVAGVKK